LVELQGGRAAIATQAQARRGRKTAQTRDGVTTVYSYDAVDRATGQQANGGWATFSYDPVGKILTKQHQGEPHGEDRDLKKSKVETARAAARQFQVLGWNGWPQNGHH